MNSNLSFFKMLADDTRLAILLLILEQEELCVCELTYVLELSQPKISRHLAMLREVGLLARRRSGKWIHYSLPNSIGVFKEILMLAAQNDAQRLDLMTSKLNEMGNRPEREKICC